MHIPARLVALAVLVLATARPATTQDWQVVEPGGDTVCSDGSPYRFFVRPGDPGRLLVEFEGGGACWDANTCSADVYNRRITIDPAQAARDGLLVGIYDVANPENPFRDWTHVYVPYCTGDLHWGTTSQTYMGAQGPFVVHHRGAINARSAIDWTLQNVPAPSRLFVAGCSAGGYGSIFWSAHLQALYPGAAAGQLGDSAAGVVPSGFFAGPWATWGVAPAWPAFVPALDPATVDVSALTMSQLYEGVAGHYPLASFAQFNRRMDFVQVLFAILTGVDGGLWSERMAASVAAILASSPNFTAYTAEGTDHCVINKPEFYTTEVGGVRLSDWVRRLASEGRPDPVP